MFRNQYDTDVTTWSPQGRLFQVEYAEESVKQGSACVGVASTTHAVLAALKRSPGELGSYQQKVFRLDDHVGLAMSGLTADGRSLVKYMRGECLNHKFVFGAPLQTERLVLDVADKHQECTQSYVRRPYGVGLLVAGCDRNGPHIYQTSPSGNYAEWRAHAIGARSQSAKTYFEKHLDRIVAGLPREELIHSALCALHSCTEADKELDLSNTVVAVVGVGEAFHLIEGEALAPYLLAVKGLPKPASAGAPAPAEGEGEAPPAPVDEPMAEEGGAPAMDVA